MYSSVPIRNFRTQDRSGVPHPIRDFCRRRLCPPIRSHPNNLDKARAHAWLASRPECDKRVGEAAQAGYRPWGSDAFRALWAFVGSI